MLSDEKTKQLEALQRFIGRCDHDDDMAELFLQGEDYEIKRVELPTLAYFMAFRFLETHPEGRSPSHIDCAAKQVCAQREGLTYDAAVMEIIDGFLAQPGFVRRFADALEDDDRDWKDSGGFKATQEARRETWHRTNNTTDKAELPANFH